jgi:FkbM family methyltransferase
MLKKEKKIIVKIKLFLYGIINRLENYNNSNFDSNGEAVFIGSLFKYLANKKTKRVLFDVGANVGDYSMMLQDYADKYNIDYELHIFEPQKVCFENIKKKFEKKKYLLNNYGLSNKKEDVKIYFDKEGSRLASVFQRNLDSHNIKMDQYNMISLDTLENYITSASIKHIDFMKIDIEGNELNAFVGAGEFLHGNFIDFIQFEYGGANLDSHTSLMEIYSFLTKREFTLARMMRDGLVIKEYEPYMDNFKYSNYIAISNKILGEVQ